MKKKILLSAAVVAVIAAAFGLYWFQPWKLFTSNTVVETPVATATTVGKWVELGRLKGTHGTQVYDIPAGTDIKEFTSVSIWCKRFSVSFGAAPLQVT